MDEDLAVARYVARKLHGQFGSFLRYYIELEDLEAEAQLAAVIEAPKYVHQSWSNRRAWLAQRVTWRLRDYIRREIGQGAKTRMLSSTIHHDVPEHPVVQEGTLDIEQRIEARLDAVGASERDRAIVYARMQDVSQKDIGDRFGITQSRVSQILTGIFGS